MLNDFMLSIANGTAPSGTVVDGGAAGSIGGGTAPYAALLDKSGETGTAPKAYLNFIVFDRDFNPILGQSGFIRLTETAKENGTDVPHERITRSEPLLIKQPGYVYIYLSNENETPVEVFFDDFKVEHVKSPVVQSDDYYPFGLTFNSYLRENSVQNCWKFQGQEHIDDLNLGWDSFKWRNHQPDIGRFFNIDPLADKYVYNSPYAFSENKVTAHIELEGLEAVGIEAIDMVDAMTPRPDPTKLTAQDKVINGVQNMTLGTIGAIAAGTYVVATEGAGGALGGGTALSLSLGEFSVGMAQVVDGVREMNTGEESPVSTTLQSVSTLPGLTAGVAQSEHAELIDAGGALLPGMLTGGNIKQLLQSPKEIISSKTVVEAAFNVANATDTFLDVSGAYNAVKTEISKTPSGQQKINWQEVSADHADNLRSFIKKMK